MPTKKPPYRGAVSIIEGPPASRAFSAAQSVIEEKLISPSVGMVSGVAPILHLSSQALVKPGQQLAPSLPPLQAPCAVFVDEITFEVAARSADNNQDPLTPNALSLGMVVAAQLDLGDHPRR